MWLNDVLNVGIRPDVLTALARARFEAAGGVVLGRRRQGDPRPSGCGGAHDCRRIDFHQGAPRDRLHGPALADCGAGAWRAPPTACGGGSCADGFEPEMNTFGDVIFADTKTEPAGGGRRGRLSDAIFLGAFLRPPRHSAHHVPLHVHGPRPGARPSWTSWRTTAAPLQGVDLDQIEPKRVLFGLFTSYKDSPLPSIDRIMQIGDAGGLQSPLSFGGFGAITRHIGRLTRAVEGALAADALRKDSSPRSIPIRPTCAAWRSRPDAPAGDAGGVE